MRKLMKSFQKRQSIASRVLCFLLVLAMVVTMVPALGGGNSMVQAAEKENIPTIRMYFEKPDGWTTPVINSWGDSVKITNGDIGNATVWGNQEKPKLACDAESGLYYVDMQCNSVSGF